MILSIKMHTYLQRGKLKKSFNSLSKRKFHLANFTHNCIGRILQDMIKYFLKHKTRHFFPNSKYLFDIRKCLVLSRNYFKTNIY